jgi:hypothetical protein
MNLKRTILLCLICLIYSASAEARDHLTPQEADLVREAQQIDKRMEIFTKAIERRISLLPGSGIKVKQDKNELEKWGPVPAGSRKELLVDIASILDEAIINIDDASDRNSSNELIPKAVARIAAASERFKSELVAQRGGTSPDEREYLERAIQYCDEILAASTKIEKK